MGMAFHRIRKEKEREAEQKKKETVVTEEPKKVKRGVKNASTDATRG